MERKTNNEIGKLYKDPELTAVAKAQRNKKWLKWFWIETSVKRKKVDHTKVVSQPRKVDTEDKY